MSEPVADAALLFECAPSGYRGIAANEDGLAILGCAAGTFAGSRLDDVVPPEAALTLIDQFERVCRTGAAVRTRLDLHLASGRVRVDASLSPVVGGAGTCEQIFVALRPLEARGGSAIDERLGESRVGVFRSETGLGNVFVNDALLEIFGATHEELLGFGWLDRIDPDDRPRARDALRLGETEGAASALVVRIIRPDGSRRRVRVHAVPLKGDDGTVTGYLGSIEDVTERLAAEETAARLTELAHLAHDFIGIADEAGVVLYLNPSVRAALGLPPEGELGTTRIVDFFPPAARGGGFRELAEALERDGRWSGDTALLARDGHEVPVRLTAIAHRDRDGRIDYYSCIGRDTSVESAHRREVERLATTLETTSDLVTFHDPAGRAFFMNRAAREFFGVEPEGPVPPVTPADLVADASAVLPAVVRSLDGDGVWQGELSLRGAERQMPASVVVVAQRDPAGDVEYYSTLARDIGERIAGEDARRRSEAALRAIVQHSPLAIFAIDGEGVVHLWNRACEEIFGWSLEEAVGRPSPLSEGDAGHPDGEDEFAEMNRRVFAGETFTDAALRSRRKDGRPVDLSLSVAPLRDASGRVITAVCVAADVTDRKRAEHALRASEARFRSVVQRSHDLTLILDRDWRVNYASPGAADFVGSTPAAMLGQPALATLHADDRDSVSHIYEDLLSKPGASRLLRFRATRGDGAERWLETIATNFLDDPDVRGVVVNSRDVTEQVEADDAQRAAEERLRALVANAGDIITVLDADGTIRYVSPAVSRILGYDEQETIGVNVFDVIHRDDLERIRTDWLEGSDRPGVFAPVEARLRRADGSWTPMEVVANNLLRDPVIRGIVITARDIAERRANENALRASDERLRESEARYRAVVDDQTELVCRYLADTTLTFVNRAFAEFYGRSVDELLGTRLLDLFAVVEHADEMARLASFAPGQEVKTQESWEIAADGSPRYYHWTDRAFPDADGRVREFQSVGHDMTEPRRAALLTQQQAEILERVARGDPLTESLGAIARAVEEHHPRLITSVLLLDPESRTLRAGAAPSLPADLARVLDDLPLGLRSGTCAAAAFRAEPVASEDIATDELWGEWRDLLLSFGLRASFSTPIRASDGARVLGTIAVYSREPGELPSDLASLVSLLAHLASIAIERREFEEQLTHQALHDLLTGLANRTLFLDRLGIALARGRRTHSQVAVLFLDLDRFKILNDTLGHDAGDELLVAAARRLESVIRPGDTVARFGGDEFTVLCEDLPAGAALERAGEIAQRLLSVIVAPFGVAGQEAFLGASIGIAVASSGDERPEDLLRDAEAAMYHAKEGGRGRFEVFDSALRHRLVARHSTETALHRALERGEFRLFYQPIISIGDERCVGAEALVRWQHPERGLVLPGEFVGLAEETDLIVELGAWVLEEAAGQAALWQVGHPEPFVVSVNLSARQLAQPDLAARLADVLARSGVRPSNLALEITESVLMEDSRGALGVVERIKALGVRLSIDDFGTGYSSLGYLKRFPVDAIKIDRSFVDGLGTDSGDTAIVSAVIGLAHALGLEVVAEGVETAEQLTELAALGCEQAQGYFFAPPQPVDDLQALIGRRRWRGASLEQRSRFGRR